MQMQTFNKKMSNKLGLVICLLHFLCMNMAFAFLHPLSLFISDSTDDETTHYHNCSIMVDNCDGVFVESIEPPIAVQMLCHFQNHC